MHLREGSFRIFMVIAIVTVISLTVLGTATASIETPQDIGENDEGLEGGFHVPLFSLAALLGLMAGITGVRNSTNKFMRGLVPLEVPRKLHRYIGATYYAVFLGTFALWGTQYYSAKGTIFHTGHGILALTTLIVAVLSIVSGALMLHRPRKWRAVHWCLVVAAYLLLLATIALGLGFED